MKKFLLIILFMTLPVYAFEDCMIVSELPIQSVKIEDENIANIIPVFTIQNDKKVLIIKPIKTGETNICVIQNDEKKILNIKISDNLTKIDKQSGFHYFSMDNPPQNLDIIYPPKTPEIMAPPKGVR